MRTDELDKFMSSGKLMAEDFLPKFAAEMERTFGEGAEKNLNSMNAAIVRSENAWKNFVTALGNSQGIIKATVDIFAKGLNVVTDFAIKGESGMNKEKGTRIAGKSISYLDAGYKAQADLMAKSGSTTDQIRLQLQKEADFKIAEIDASLAKNKVGIAKLESEKSSLMWTMGGESTTKRLNEIYSLVRKAHIADETNLLLKEALTAIPDKVVARYYMKPNGGLDTSKTAKTKTSKDSERVRGVKHITTQR